MAIKNSERGFALLISVIFMSVMLSFGLALSSLSYKQQILASNGIESQYAFYAADTALECLLYADQYENKFTFTGSPPSSMPSVTCDGSSFSSSEVSRQATQWVVTTRVSLDGGKHCADATIYKPSPGLGTTYLFAQGYNVSCGNVTASGGGTRLVSRGLSAHY